MSSWNDIAKSVRAKIAVSARLLGKEVTGCRLRWLDLPQADLRLGEKVFADPGADVPPEVRAKLEEISQRKEKLGQLEAVPPTTLGQKTGRFLRAIGRAIKSQKLEARRRRVLREFAGSLRGDPGKASGFAEAGAATAVVIRLRATESEIAALRPQTYRWARRPLLLVSLLVLLAAIGAAALELREPTPPSAWNNSGNLTDDQVQEMQAEAAKFSEQTQRMLAESRGRENKWMQKIEDQQRAYDEEGARRLAARAAAQKKEQEIRDAALRAQQKEEAAAAERVRLEEENERKLAQEKAERERLLQEQERKAEQTRKAAELLAATRAEEKRQRDLAERLAKETEATQLLSKVDLEAIMGFKFQEPKGDKPVDPLSSEQLEQVEKTSSCFFDSDLPKSNRFNHGVRLTVRYLTESDADRAEDSIRHAAFRATGLRPAGLKHFSYSAFTVQSSIYVFKPTPEGCTMLEVAIDGAPSDLTRLNDSRAYEERLTKEKAIAVKILGPTVAQVDPYEVRHPAPVEREERSASQRNYLPDIPGVDSRTMSFFNGFFQRAAAADETRVNSSKSAAASSYGAKMVCPKCHGSKLMVAHSYNSSYNPYGYGSLEHGLYENGRNQTNFVPCDECGGTGVVDAR